MEQISILDQAVNKAMEEKPGCNVSMEALVEESYKHFVQLKLNDFPRMCEVARMQNKILLDELKNYGNKGKYTESYGWSNDGSFKWEFEIPQDLYLFMKCMVYKDFWDNSNKRISKAFMNAICRGDDPMTTLMKVKSIYGSNKDVSLIT